MSTFLGSAWWLLVTLGILVTFHEFGHYWVARRCGVRVLRFSIGFGKPLWSRIGRNGVEFAVGAIPLGGYVKFLDAREADDPAAVARQPGEFNAAPVGRRMAIAVAGPLANLLFTVAAFWAMFVVGRPDFQPVLGPPQGLAAQAGFAAGDRIVAVGDEAVDSWSSVILAVGEAAMRHRDVRVRVRDAQGRDAERTLALSHLPADVAGDKTFEAIGLALAPLPAVAGEVPDGPAARAGLKPGDRIVRVNEVPIGSFADLVKAVQDQAAKDPRLHVTVARGGATLTLDILAEAHNDDGKTVWRIGMAGRDPRDALERYDPLRAVPAALRETAKQAASTLGILGSMLTGQVSTKNLSSVIGIAEVANASAQMGLAWFLAFLATISLSLAILNLLPIPVLDGGHLLYYLIELVKGSPLSERAMIAGQYVGVALLAILMSIAFYNDIVRHIAG
jgi:regulator of sigma E protease